MTETYLTDTLTGVTRPAPRGRRCNSRRDNLFAATMLVPVLAVSMLAAGKLSLRPGGLVPLLMDAAQAQQNPATAGSGARPGPSAGVPAAAPPPGSTAPTAAAAQGASSAAVTVLLEQASYWRNQSQFDQAIESLNRALALDPSNLDALALLGQIQAERGNRPAAESALSRLRTVAPDDPRVAKIDQALRVGPVSQDQLAEARRLAREGHQAEAIDRYNRVFRGNPPPDAFAVEYYQTLAGTDGGWEQARDGLAQLVRQNPQDLRSQLAYAQILTYRDATRPEGIARLAALSRNPSVSEQASQSWRQALNWLPSDKSALNPLTIYLQSHPNDADIASKLEMARNPTPDANDPSATDRNTGFDALNAGKLGAAAAAFQRAIDRNANDSDATGGLGIVRLRQQRFADARSLLARAIELNPDQRGHWQPALDGARKALAGATSGGGGGGATPNLAAPAQALLNRGDYAGAERQLQRAIATGRDNSGGLQAMLADAQAQLGRLGDAEASYRQALARNPRNIGALTGLAGVLSREGRSDEAQTLLAQAQSMGGGRQVGQARAAALREQAQNITDPATQAALYRESVAADPSNPWIRLDLARALVKQHQLAQAREVMHDAVGRGASADTLKAAIIFANETNDPDAAAALVARLPPSARTPDMLVLQANASLQRQIAAALQAPPRSAREQLLRMAAAPDPDGARGAAIARALEKLGDKEAARNAILIAQSSSRGQDPAAKIAYASAFLDADDPAGAQRMLSQVDPSRGLSAEQRRSYAQLTAGLAIRSSDQLNQSGRQADAYDRLAPALAQSPDSPDLNMALARVYQGARNPREALQINEAVLARDPSNAEARRAAIGAALQIGNRARAATLARDGVQLSPNDPLMWMSSADVARATGNTGGALRDLERARQLRLQQLGYADNGDDHAALAGVSLVPGAPARYGQAAPRPVYVPAAPAAGGGSADGGADPSTSPPGTSSWYGGAQEPQSTPPGTGAAVPLAPAAPNAPSQPWYPLPAAAPGPRDTRGSGAGGGSAVAVATDYPYGRMLDTSPTNLPDPRAGTPSARSADQLNTQEMNALRAPGTRASSTQISQTQLAPPAYQAPTYSAQSYQPPGSQPPSYQSPSYQAPSYPPGSPAVPAAAPYVPPRPVAPAQNGGPSTLNNAPVTGPGGYYANPFRSSPSGFAPSDQGIPGTSPLAQQDPETAEIDRDIQALRGQVAPAVQGGIGFRSRSGETGLDQLTEINAPLEAEGSPGGYGRLKVMVTPTSLDGGKIQHDVNTLQRFGTSAFGVVAGNQGSNFVNFYSGALPKSQYATGVGLDASYSMRYLTGDFGTTPLGFSKTNLIGGLELAPQLTDNLTLRLTGERRAMTDSVLSYAGTSDTRTGATWGGETRARGRANLEFGLGNGGYLYVGGGGGEVSGTHVPTNGETEAGLGGSVPVYTTPTQQLFVGLDLVYFGYSKNLRYFTFGQGGYFSPQSYGAALVPVIWRDKIDDDLSYEVGAAAGIQSFHEKSTPYYPDDPGLQAQLVAQQSNAATFVPGLQTIFAGSNKTGFTGNAHAEVDYRVTPNLHLGLRGAIEKAGNYTEGSGVGYARYIFNPTSAQ